MSKRLYNYHYGVAREQKIKRLNQFVQYLPFIRGLGLVGSQALGQYKAESDIDVLIFVEHGYMWLGRTVITLYFQLLGVRRHGTYIPNRFCLNHYVAGSKILNQDRNIYTASEYVKLRSLYPSVTLANFQLQNEMWIKLFFPNFSPVIPLEHPSLVQSVLERLLNNPLGRRMDTMFRQLWLPRIKQDKFILVAEDELSFHPHNRKAMLFSAFFKSQK